jgi:sugar lactone lactonase YvrE
MAVDDQDQLLVIDYMNARVTRFTPDHEIDQTFRLDHEVVTGPRAF